MEAPAMQDFTLVVPTHNRPHQLAGLLGYLEAEAADFRVIVLDSSREDVLAVNCMRAARSMLDLAYIVIPNETLEEKWSKGLRAVTTPYCGLCGDDDLVILAGIRRCLDALRRTPEAAVADAYSFVFQYHSDDAIELDGYLFFQPTIEAPSPLDRLARLFRQYQPPIYGVFRTPVLQRIYDMLEPLGETLSRELLWSALTAVEGSMIRLPCFGYGRRMSASASPEHWHPLEWICNDANGCLAEYARYRGVLSAAVLQRPDNVHSADEVRSILDLIHLRHLLRSAPASVLGQIVGQEVGA
jgi:glycosyltransferase domain-containing protein